MNDIDNIKSFISDQIFNAESEQSARLAYAIREAIKAFKESGGENENAFSVDAQYENGEFSAQCDFNENFNMTIMLHEDTDNKTVDSLFNLENDKELCRMAGLILSEGWVEGWVE